ncbi:hypothetical protein GCM10025857_04360 [Alicyclobacillus contaminans]|uniref:YlxM family DNA-binding protein n=1 Tax=Alicyclobacillus contaminans TaxID=392016 RepID=UPI0004020D85|nr:YlxM family DNA-binding protein [Alicyclobacillus contaminans]GMA49079.1 hypothetical protein GCM10025857_04360 [Alicyclobacillus contaminans]
MTRDHRMIDKVTRTVSLYDWYGALLTDRQRELIELYYFDDLSLAEIAEQLNISRQAVHDNLKRAEEQLEHFEGALHLLASEAERRSMVRQVWSAWSEIEDKVPAADRERFESALRRLISTDAPERGDDHA